MKKDNLPRLRALHGALHEKRLALRRERQVRAMVREGQKQSLALEQNAPVPAEDYPVDFVITYLDGSDPAWIAEKNRYLPDDPDTARDNSAARFRDWDTLRYWFRGVERYAPWVRRVYLVTWGHVPVWLNRDCPKLRVVTHGEFMPPEYLPTFNCFPLELNFWRIPGLSEHFVYFNDDMFLTAPVEKSDFFRGGLPRHLPAARPVFPRERMTAWEHMLFGTAGIINSRFDVRACIQAHPEKWFSHRCPGEVEYNLRAWRDGRLTGMVYPHLAIPYRVSTAETVWEHCRERLDSASRHRFRSPDDVLHQLFSLWEMMEGNFDPVSPSHYGLAKNITPETVDELETAIAGEHYRMVCPNDSESLTQSDFPEMRRRLIRVMEQKFPEQSAFER